MAALNLVQRTLGRALSETGSSLQRLGMAMVSDWSYYDHISQHATTVGFGNGDMASVGINVILEESVTVGAGAEIADNAVVKAKTVVPPGELWAGSPAAFVKKL